MDSFKNLTRMDRRKFLASLIAIGASAGVLGKLGLEDIEWTAAGPGELYLDRMIYSIDPSETPIWQAIKPEDKGKVSNKWEIHEIVRVERHA